MGVYGGEVVLQTFLLFGLVFFVHIPRFFLVLFTVLRRLRVFLPRLLVDVAHVDVCFGALLAEVERHAYTPVRGFHSLLLVVVVLVAALVAVVIVKRVAVSGHFPGAQGILLLLFSLLLEHLTGRILLLEDLTLCSRLVLRDGRRHHFRNSRD